MNTETKPTRQPLLALPFVLLSLGAAAWFLMVLHPPDPRSRVPVHTASFAVGLLLFSLTGGCACVCRALAWRWMAFGVGVASLVMPALLALDSEIQLVGGISTEGMRWLAFLLVATSAPVWLALLNPAQADGASTRKPGLAVVFMAGGLLAGGLSVAFLAAGAFAGAFGGGSGGPPEQAGYVVAGLYLYFVTGAVACLLEGQGGRVAMCLLGHACAIFPPMIFLRRGSWGSLLLTTIICCVALFALGWWRVLKAPSPKPHLNRCRSE